MVVSLVVFPQVAISRRAALAAASLFVLGALCAPRAHALERVTLRSGFTVECDHHELVEGRIRAYTGAGGDFQDFSVGQVVHIDFLPDPPKPVPTAKSAPVPAAKPILLAKPAAFASPAQPHATIAPMPVLAVSFPVNPHAEPDYKDLLLRAGAEHNIDVELLASVIHAESGYRANAVSRAGARGLMQLMPSTARTFGAHNLFRAEENIAAGTAFLDELLKRYHDDLALALAAYNAGPAAVERYHGVPPFRETRAYVTRVIGEFYRRKIALGASPAGPQQAIASASSPASEQVASTALATAALKSASTAATLPTP